MKRHPADVSSTREVLALLGAYESRNVTFVDPHGGWPIVWSRARGSSVWDADGRRYLDLTAAFGVAAAGHANPRVVRAGQKQMSRLLHAMGDVHPHEPKARLSRELSRLTFERWSRGGRSRSTGKTIFCSSGFEAVEAALKTAALLTRKRGVIAFEGGYHGLGYGALNATHRKHFRGPFRSQLGEFGRFVPFPAAAADKRDLSAIREAICRIAAKTQIGAVMAEPVQARGGINIPPDEFLPMLRDVCDATGALLILDEIYTGFGRTGEWFACERAGVVPDVICLGKGLAGGFPLSACVGRSDLMDAAWPASSGEAIHTSTFLGHPVGCAMALANIEEIRSKKLIQRSRKCGAFLLRRLRERFEMDSCELQTSVRGVGLMAAVELRNADGSPATERSLSAIKEMLRLGYILLPEGEHANVISFTPPLVTAERDLQRAVDTLADVVFSRTCP